MNFWRVIFFGTPNTRNPELAPYNVNGIDDESDGERISNLIDSRVKGKIRLTKYWSDNNTITPCHLINCIFPLGLKDGLQYYQAINDN